MIKVNELMSTLHMLSDKEWLIIRIISFQNLYIASIVVITQLIALENIGPSILG